MDFTGKCALITGATGGIGRVITKKLHDAGATVIITDMRQESLDAFAAQSFDNGCRRWSDWPCQWPSGDLRAAQQCCFPDPRTCSCQLYCIGSYNCCGIGCAMILGNFIAMRFIRNVNKKLYQKVIAGIMIAVSLRLVVSQII